MPTQSDVARLAGVSTATVSRVINGRDVVTSAVRQRVEAAIESLEYVPHAGARALALKRSGILGAIIPSLNNAIFAEGINAFEQAARSMGYTLILSVSHNDPRHHSEQVRRMVEQGVDGLFLVGNAHDHNDYQRLNKAGLRYLCGWAYDVSAPSFNVGFDNAEAMHAVVDHLVAQGHRDFGMLSGITMCNDRAVQRVAGVRQRLQQHGLNLEASRIAEVPYSIPESRRALWQLLNHDITALICGNDVLAIGVVLEACKMGLRIPGDLAVTGFDDLELASQISPAITTVRVSADLMGRRAATLLVDAIEGRVPLRGEQVPTELVVRESTVTERSVAVFS